MHAERPHPVPILALAALALVPLLSRPAAAAPKAAHDLSLRMKVSSSTTLGPAPKLVVKNRGTADALQVSVSVRADEADGEVLWSDTVDVPAGRSVKLASTVYPPDGTLLLVAVVGETGVEDASPGDNVARSAFYATAGRSHGLVGRALVAGKCAGCHGEAGSGGSAPAIARATVKSVADALQSGSHDFPTLGKTDVKDICRYLKDPEAAVPVEPPAAPEGGWPGYEEDVYPVLKDYCGACHFGRNYSAGVKLDTFQSASRSASRSLASIRRGSMPQGGRRVKAEERQLLDDWITGGRRP